MKLKLLLTLLLIHLFVFINAQGPPPPCGLSGSYACDGDLNGSATVNLELFYPVITCSGVILTNYENQFFLTEEDQINNVNAIPNPETFEISSEAVTIYIRSRNIDTDQVQLREKVLELVIPPTPATPTPLYACDYNGDGFAEFSLGSGAKSNEILSSQGGAYIVRYFETLEDAQNLVNPILDVDTPTYTNVTAFQQTIYAAVFTYGNLMDVATASCIEVVPLELITTEGCEDLSVNLINPNGLPRPGFDFENLLTVENAASTTIASATVTYELDAEIILNSVVSSDPSVGITVTANGFIAEFDALEANYEASLTISLNCPASVSLGTSIVNTATYTTNTNDQNSENDISQLTQTVVGSFDPNDIMESHGTEILYEDFINSDEFLFYTIRFQNVGTAEAINVKIENTFNNQLDESSFQMLRSSHSVNTLRTGNTVEWTFDNINLPAEQDNADESNGFVYFKIKPKVGYSVGDVIPNSAAIYFDFNEPIITNTFTTTFGETLSLNAFEKSNFSIYPNPSKGKVTMEFHTKFEDDLNLEMYDVHGKLVYVNKSITSRVSEIDFTGLSLGLYFVHIKSSKSSIIKKLIIN